MINSNSQAPLPPLEWEKVLNSSQIKETAYREVESTVYIKFKNNSVYSYSPFLPQQFKEFRSAPSSGKYFHRHIKKLNTTKING